MLETVIRPGWKEQYLEMQWADLALKLPPLVLRLNPSSRQRQA